MNFNKIIKKLELNIDEMGKKVRQAFIRKITICHHIYSTSL